MSSNNDEDIIDSIEESKQEEDDKEDDESLVSVSDDDISIGGANDDKTKCKCTCCEKVHYIKPEWTYESECPSCTESMFSYMCPCCSSYCNNYGCSSEPAFPNQPCAQCDKTREEEEEEDRCQESLREEKIRVSNGANFRAAKIREPWPVYQNNIMLTYQALYGNARPGAEPICESDSLRMSDDDWEDLRPLVVAELEDESILNITWCKHQISVFERSWQSDNMTALERGTLEDWTGKPHMLFNPFGLRIGIRSLREAQMEEGTMPIAPLVVLDTEAWYKTAKYEKGKRLSSDPLANFLTWGDLPDNFNEDPRDIYKLDGNKTMNLFEFLIWSARCGGFGNQRPSSTWCLEGYTEDFNRRRLSTVEPIAYVPTDWVGRPEMFSEESYGRWHWLQDQMKKGDFADMSDVHVHVEANMKRCSHCYGLPKDGRSDLLLCECSSVYWCSEACKKEAWELHSLDHRTNHTEVKRVCMACGNQGGNELLRCGRCKNAFFCNKECQKVCWTGYGSVKGHKDECKEYLRGGRPEWSSTA